MTKSKARRYTIRDFGRDFSNDAACLEWLRNYLYPKGIFCKVCLKITKHHAVRTRPSYSCDRCGHHFHPTAGTIFEKSSTPLRLWFRAIYLMASNRFGISAKQLQRETGVTYKTAWRMFRQIRTLLGNDNRPPSGRLGGTAITTQRRGKTAIKQASHPAKKTPVSVDRKRPANLVPSHAPRTTGRLSRQMRRVYRGVRKSYLHTYINEYWFRYKHRHHKQPMFKLFLRQVSVSC